MFDKYLINEATVKNTGPLDAPDGFAFDAKLGYYRGIGLSMIDDLVITVNQKPVERADISLRLRQSDEALPLIQFGMQLEQRWEFGETATIVVKRPGGLLKGTHQLGLKQVLRISYLPFPGVSEDLKDITIS